MLINGTSSAAARTAVASNGGGAKANIDYNSFLKLLIASMKNQDPTQPNDPAQTLSQLASFSNVEQAIKLNGKLDSLISMSGGEQAGALVGKTVSNLDGSLRGAVQSVELESGRLTIILEDGKRIEAIAGFRVSA